MIPPTTIGILFETILIIIPWNLEVIQISIFLYFKKTINIVIFSENSTFVKLILFFSLFIICTSLNTLSS